MDSLAWTLVQRWVAQAANDATVLPPDPEAGPATLGERTRHDVDDRGTGHGQERGAGCREDDKRVKLGHTRIMQSLAWTLVQRWVAQAANDATVLPADPDAGPAALEALGVTDRSLLGALAVNTGGLAVDHGWLRVLGGPSCWNGATASTAASSSGTTSWPASTRWTSRRAR